MHACSRIHHKLSFHWLYCGCGQQNPLICRRKECSFVLFFKLVNVSGKFPRVSARESLLSFGLFLRSVLKFYGVGTALMRTFDLYFIQRWTFAFFLGCLLDAAQLLWTVLVELVPKFLCPSEKSIQILAVQRPVIRNPTVAHFSLSPLHFCHHPSSAFCWVGPQPSSAEMSTRRLIYSLILTSKTDIREDANSHKVI